MLVNNCVKLLLYPCHKTEEHLRETGELKAGNVSYIFTQYSMDQMQDRETNPNNFYKKNSQIFWQENEGTPKRSYLASVIQQVNDSLVMWCFLVYGSHCVEFWREIFKLSLDKWINLLILLCFGTWVDRNRRTVFAFDIIMQLLFLTLTTLMTLNSWDRVFLQKLLFS